MASTLYNDLEVAINFNSDVLDKSGNGRDGTVDGMTYDTTTPIIGSGTGEFDGINDDVEIDVDGAKSGILDATVGTVALWVRLTAPLEELKYLFSVTQGGVAHPVNDQWAIMFRGDTATNEIQAFAFDNEVLILNARNQTSGIFDSNKHLIIIRAKSSGDLEILIDDDLKTITTSPSTAKFFGHAVDADTMRIGSIGRDTILYDGSKDVDALAIASRPWTDAECTEYWNSGNGVELEVIAGVVIQRRRMGEY